MGRWPRTVAQKTEEEVCLKGNCGERIADEKTSRGVKEKNLGWESTLLGTGKQEEISFGRQGRFSVIGCCWQDKQKMGN